jgi:pimeloyl-ACP methyl ester carboxylesterase
LGIKNFFIMGWSMGGNISMKLAAQIPEQIEGLILLNSAGAKGFIVNKVDENGNLTNERARTKEEVYRHPYCIKLVNTTANQDREPVREELKEYCFNGNNTLSPERLEVHVDEWLKCKCADCLPYNSNRYNISNEHSGVTEGTNEISNIKCKTLILHGENDLAVLKKEAEYIKSCLGDLAEIKIFDNSGHIVIEDYPLEVLKLIKEFCS